MNKRIRIDFILLDILYFFYRLFRPLLGPRRCRFVPSCSEYAVKALKAHGPFKGLSLILARVFRCHPWNPGGWDPVP